MSKLFEGTFNVVFNASKNEVELKKADDGKYTAEDANAIWELVVSRKKPLSKWSFYVAGFNQDLGREVSNFDPVKAIAWLKRQKTETQVSVGLGKWGKPVLRIEPKVATKPTKSADVEIW
jgi:hypothetical protein